MITRPTVIISAAHFRFRRMPKLNIFNALRTAALIAERPN